MTALTIATLNLWGTTAPWRERMELAASQLAARAVQAVLVQEADSCAELLSERLAMPHVQFSSRAPGFSLAIISALPLAKGRCLTLPAPAGETRLLLSSQVVATGHWLHCTHLSHQLGASLVREQQVVRIAAELRAIDDSGLHILGGDMNADPDSDAMRFLRGQCSLGQSSTHMQDAWLRHHDEGEQSVTWCMQAGAEREARSVDVDRRLDYLYVSSRAATGRNTIEASGKVCDSPGPGGLYASDHCGVWARVRY